MRTITQSKLNAVRALALMLIALAYATPARAEDVTFVCMDCVISYYMCDDVGEPSGCQTMGMNCQQVCWYCLSGGNGCS